MREREFEKVFLRDDGLMDKYCYDETGDTVTTGEAIIAFHSQTIEGFKSLLREELGKMKSIPRNTIDVGSYETTVVGVYNEAISDFLALLNDN